MIHRWKRKRSITILHSVQYRTGNVLTKKVFLFDCYLIEEAIIYPRMTEFALFRPENGGFIALFNMN